MVSATSKSRSAVLDFCMVWPSTLQAMVNPEAPGGSSSGGTSAGPTGVGASKGLPERKSRLWGDRAAGPSDDDSQLRLAVEVVADGRRVDVVVCTDQGAVVLGEQGRMH